VTATAAHKSSPDGDADPAPFGRRGEGDGVTVAESGGNRRAMTLLQRSSSLLLAALAVPLACSHRAPPPAAPPPEIEEEEDAGGAAVAVSSAIGGMNEEQVSRVFSRAAPAFKKCLDYGANRVEFLGGDVELYALIDASGKLLHAHMAASTLGDRATEKCLLEVLEKQTWPRPVGGDRGVVRKAFGLEPSGDVRPPVAWSAEDVQDGLRRVERELDECRQGVRGVFTATMYVDTNGSPLAVGMTPPSDEGEAVVDCLVDVLESARFRSPGGWPAKVTFEL